MQSIHHHAGPAAVLLTYHQEVVRSGKRGALRRAGDRHGISDETVRRYVLAEAARAAGVDQGDELAYIPPPGGYAEPEPMPQNATQTPQNGPQQADEAGQEDVADANSDVADPDASEAAVPEEEVPRRHTTMIEIRRSEPLPRIYPNRRLRPRWSEIALDWGQAHMPAVQLLAGLIIVSMMILVAF